MAHIGVHFDECQTRGLRSANEVEAGQRVYTPLVLWGYDLLVLGFSNRFVWRCRSSRSSNATTATSAHVTSTSGSALGGFSTTASGRSKPPNHPPRPEQELAVGGRGGSAATRLRRFRRTYWIRLNWVMRASTRSARTTSSTAFRVDSSRRSGRLRRTSVPTSRRAASFSEPRSSAAASSTTRSDVSLCVSTTGRESSRT